MPRPRTAQTVYQEQLDLIYERWQKCYLSGNLANTSINQPKWDELTARIEALDSEAKRLELTEKAQFSST